MSDSRGLGFPPCTPAIDFSKKIDLSNVKDQSVLVTGGANGMGEAFAIALAEAGACVTILDIQEERGNAIVHSLSQKGLKIQYIKGDVCSWDDQTTAFEAALSFSPFHSLDIVLMVAGIAQGPSGRITQWLDSTTSTGGRPAKPDTKCLDVNLTAVWYSTHLGLHYFRKSLGQETRSATSKQLVYVSSLAGFSDNANITDYAASKWGVRGLWRSIRVSPGLLGEKTSVKLRTNLIAPWFVRTAMTEQIVEIVKDLGMQLAEVSDAVDAMLRIVCDETVDKRAIAVAPNGNNFDYCDDIDGFEGGREWPEHMVDKFGATVGQLASFFGLKPSGL